MQRIPPSEVFKQAPWEELKKGDVIFDIDNHNDVQHVLFVPRAKSRKLIKLEDLSEGVTKWYTKLRYDTKRYHYLDK